MYIMYSSYVKLFYNYKQINTTYRKESYICNY
uniref:Uncharacterized protein n=1 Tax=CrAss-like virus sp. ctXt06 TaxID=2825837 RepID=A0A8S5V6Q9_9CAUD|nr:MAG TPA: hypothetical protein [CrAss-like virus sp. ctXt06]